MAVGDRTKRVNNIRTTNAVLFAKTLRKWAADVVPEEHAEYQREVANYMLLQLVEISPVAYGELRAGWVVGIGTRGSKPAPIFDAYGNATLSRGKAVIKGLQPFQRVNFTNYTPQATVADKGLFRPANPGPSKRGHPPGMRVGQVLVSGGFSTQAPNGIVQVARDRTEARFAVSP